MPDFLGISFVALANGNLTFTFITNSLSLRLFVFYVVLTFTRFLMPLLVFLLFGDSLTMFAYDCFKAYRCLVRQALVVSSEMLLS